MNDYTLHAIIAILTLLLGGETAAIARYFYKAAKARREAAQHGVNAQLAEIRAMLEEKK
ncbi:MAG: hypothetical protein FWB76_00340 [Oscillospiraceae bacterium]|nr:hypothetical protein [Oscillospiraceae bacterium]